MTRLTLPFTGRSFVPSFNLLAVVACTLMSFLCSSGWLIITCRANVNDIINSRLKAHFLPKLIEGNAIFRELYPY
jgi:chromosome condensin MukBEF complex kleisin-like MukF subunit